MGIRGRGGGEGHDFFQYCFLGGVGALEIFSKSKTGLKVPV